MGRGDLIRSVALALAVVAAVASAAAAATGVRWGVLATGHTTGAGQQPVGYVAVTKAQEQPILARLGTSSTAAALRRVNLQYTGVIGVFLDGIPCSGDLTVNSVTRTATTVTVTLHYTRPPIGAGMCVRLSTPYVLISATRKSLGHPAPTHVRIVAVARA